MVIPTAQEFKETAQRAIQEQKTWAETNYQIDLPIKLSITDTKLNYYGQASTRRDRREEFLGYGIKLCSFTFIRYPQIAVSEYASFNGRSEIGGFVSNDWRLGVETLVAHEMAHVIQFALRMAAFDAKARGTEHPLISHWNNATPVFTFPYGEYEGSHGSFFQRIYRDVRRQFINSRVELSAYTMPSHSFLIPDDFEERLAVMPKSGLEGIRFVVGGQQVEVVGRNPKTTSRLFGYVVKNQKGNYLRIKMALIAAKSPEAKSIIEQNPELHAEFYQHCLAIQSKMAANRSSSHTKQRRAANRRRSG